MMTEDSLAKDLHQHEMTFIVYHLHEDKLQADSRVTNWQSTDIHQCHTPTVLPRAYLKDPSHMPFLNQHSMEKHPLHVFRISQRFTLE